MSTRNLLALLCFAAALATAEAGAIYLWPGELCGPVLSLLCR